MMIWKIEGIHPLLVGWKGNASGMGPVVLGS